MKRIRLDDIRRVTMQPNGFAHKQDMNDETVIQTTDAGPMRLADLRRRNPAEAHRQETGHGYAEDRTGKWKCDRCKAKGRRPRTM
jgi:hypothetical protein